MSRTKGHLIKRVQEGSIAADLGLRPGDRLMRIDGHMIRDLFDYQLRQMNEKLLLTVRSAAGDPIEFDIEKDEDEDLGLDFANTLMDDCRICRNHCIFCFIDQLPRGLRSSLYVKDDDMRLSFLTGNYVTLTNLDDHELDRLIACRLSPVNVSVHATDNKIRRQMMRNRKAADILPRLRKIASACLSLNAQIVLCPGINDGTHLHETIGDLAEIGPALKSIAIVPVGITRFRTENGLYALRPLTASDAAAVISEVENWQHIMLPLRGTRLVYAADEIYLKSGRALPPADEYEDFPQLENGVGMLSLFMKELAEGLQVEADETTSREPLISTQPRSCTSPAEAMGAVKIVILVSGAAAGPLLRSCQDRLAAWSGIGVHTASIVNRFFGDMVTVAGLLTGQDLAAQLPDVIRNLPEKAVEDGGIHVILPACMFKAGEDAMLDEFTSQQLADRLGVPVHICPADAEGLLGILTWLKKQRLRVPPKPGQEIERGEGR